MNLEKNFRVFLNLLNSNKFDECLNKLKIEKKLSPSPLYENLHGIILAKKNLMEDAKVQFLSTIKNYPDFPDAYFNLGTIISSASQLIESFGGNSFFSNFLVSEGASYTFLNGAISKPGGSNGPIRFEGQEGFTDGRGGNAPIGGFGGNGLNRNGRAPGGGGARFGSNIGNGANGRVIIWW
jgi:hypothetical protein